MRIAQIATNLWKIPPKSGNATQLIVGQLTEELVKRGHEVTLYASGDTQTAAKLVSIIPRCINFDPRRKIKWNTTYDLTLMSKLCQEAKKYDIIHSHCGVETAYFSPLINTPMVTTLHSPLDYSPQNKILPFFAKTQYYVSVSNNQREFLPNLNYIATVYHGADIKSLKFRGEKGEYLAFLGRIDFSKGTDIAVRVAKKAKEKLVIAGVIHRGEKNMKFWFDRIEPALKYPGISYIGPIEHKQKSGFLRRAKALIFPTRPVWREPFGLVMIEAMACGTPVIGFNYGSIPEVIVHGRTGFVVESEKEMVEAIGKINQIDRKDCRVHVEKNFTVEKMVDNYEMVYEKIVNST